MAYEKTNWVNGETPINADNLNNMESGIASAFRFLGKELIASVEDDTTANWAALGDGIVYYETAGLLNNQPTTYGFVENIVCCNLVFQTFHAMNGKSGKWTRSGNSSGWYSGSANWVKSLDETNGIQIKKLWENASPTSTFSAQTISLTIGSTSKALIVYAVKYYNGSSEVTGYKTEIIDVGKCGVLENASMANSTSYYVNNKQRSADVKTSGVSFGTSYVTRVTMAPIMDNNGCIPIAIYEIKGGE